jgi:hydroxymethylpyrimidine/phosphomethylpyrimidine kinase
VRGRVLIIAGSDSGGGIQADIKTVTMLDGYAATAVTALTAQNTEGVFGVLPIPPDFIRRQIEVVLDDIGVDAVKTGMLASSEIVRVSVERLRRVPAPLVVDPVCVSKHGDPLVDPEGVEAMVSGLLPLATVVTPNLAEVTRLTGVVVTDPAGQRRAADALLALGPRWALVKGGHLLGEPVDLLTDGDTVVELRGPRLDNAHTHGTGCTLAAAIASHLAAGRAVPDAVRLAKEFVTGAIAAGFPLGAGIGPVDHGWRQR